MTALAVLQLVEQKRLDLDGDVNDKLRSWKAAENDYTKEKKVTVRRLLSHSAGVNVHSFVGYSIKTPLPTLDQVLDGMPPANTPAIRVTAPPGSKWGYSGGGYVVLQQLLVEVSGKSFPTLMDDMVLRPIGMTQSTFEQTLPSKLKGQAAVGYLTNGKAIEGGWLVYPEMAAAGLWTTASDLARFEIAIQKAFVGDGHGVITPSTAREMLTRQKKDMGLGVFLAGQPDRPVFYHEGRNDGFDSEFAAATSTKKGAVVLVNKNDDVGAIGVIMRAIAKKYAW